MDEKKVDIALISRLRKKTGVSIADCKKALIATLGDVEKAEDHLERAEDHLRAQGKAKAAGKSDREAIDGLIAVSVNGNNAAMIELNTETDFVARNEKFQKLAEVLLGLLSQHQDRDLESFGELKVSEGVSINDYIKDHIATLGENITLSKKAKLNVINKGVIGSYVHNEVAPGIGMGKIAALVALESEGDKEKLQSFAKKLAMHIVASKPKALSIDLLDENIVNRERAIFEKEVSGQSKPQEVLEKIVTGKMNKFYQDSVLLEQVFVIDGKTKISDLIKALSEELGADVKISDYKMFTLGERV